MGSTILFKRQTEYTNIAGFCDIDDIAHHCHVIANNYIKRKRCAIEFSDHVYEVVINGNRFNRQQPLKDDGKKWETDFDGVHIFGSDWKFLRYVTERNNKVEQSVSEKATQTNFKRDVHKKLSL